MHATSRRSFLCLGVASGAALAMPGCATGPVRTAANPAYLQLQPASRPGCAALAMTPTKLWRSACQQAVSRTSDLAWLKRGDSVFVKVVSNSGHAHPAVTAPQAVEAMVALLRDAGAGRVLVGDQAGVEHVRRWKTGRRSSTRQRFAQNGLLQAIERSGAELFCFDDQPWEMHFRPQADFANLWGDRLWLPSIVREVDHIVVLPRLGAHALAGYSCGVKAAVGWLRDDSRLALHREGDVFFQRLAEINHVPELRNKVRLVVTLVDKALTSIGPDFGAVYEFPGCLALASTSLVDHDAVASLLLPWLREHSGFSFYDFYEPYPEHVNYWNRRFVEDTWGEPEVTHYRSLVPGRFGAAIAQDVALSHLATLQQRRVDRIVVRPGADRLPDAIMAHLRSSSAGMVAI